MRDDRAYRLTVPGSRVTGHVVPLTISFGGLHTHTVQIMSSRVNMAHMGGVVRANV